MELTDRVRAVLGVLAEADRDLYVAEIAERAQIHPSAASALLLRMWQSGWTGRRWDGARRYYPITDQGRAAWTEIRRQTGVN